MFIRRTLYLGIGADHLDAKNRRSYENMRVVGAWYKQLLATKVAENRPFSHVFLSESMHSRL
jgi:hypothetical protein